MALLLTDSREEVERLVASFIKRFGWSEELVRYTVLAGSAAQVQDTVGRLRDAGVDQLFIPTFFPAWSYERLDRFITEVAPAFR